MSSHQKQALAYAREHQDIFLEKLVELAAIPSVSTSSSRQDDIKAAAQWLKEELLQLGMTRVEIIPTPRHPIVYAENTSAGKDAPTALIYGHYDVQPEDPVDQWNTDPFTPTRVDENLYGRGTTDMKGQIIASLSAVEAVSETGDLPLNIKF